ncbi:RabGAP/TBC [Neoconidiobolus thromboides FSU 785]|nr:RabGAP/TBC [Neoconidiobolus thromboides FSU 785]
MMEFAYPIPISPGQKTKQFVQDESFYEDTIDEFHALLTSEMYVDLSKLQQLSRYGIPDELRGEVWKYLLKTESSDRTNDMELSKARMEEYQQLIQISYDEQNKVRGEVNRLQQRLKKTLPCITYERVIGAYLNYNKQAQFHPSWVHLCTPFITVVGKEVDVFYCFQNLVEKIDEVLDEDTLHEKISQFKSLFRKVIPDLYDYFEEEQVNIHDWVPSWLRFLLSKELSIESLLPLWDLYFSSNDFMDFHVYICIGILKQFKDYLEELEGSEIKAFLSRLPPIDIFTIRQIALDLRHNDQDSNLEDI